MVLKVHDALFLRHEFLEARESNIFKNKITHNEQF